MQDWQREKLKSATKWIGGIAIGFLLIVLFLDATSTTAHPRIPMNQMRAETTLRDVVRVQRNFEKRNQSLGFACTFDDLVHKSPDYDPEDLDRVTASGFRSGYLFELKCAESSKSRNTRYVVTAVPAQPGLTGEFALCTDETGDIWADEEGSASACLKAKKPFKNNWQKHSRWW